MQNTKDSTKRTFVGVAGFEHSISPNLVFFVGFCFLPKNTRLGRREAVGGLAVRRTSSYVRMYAQVVQQQQALDVV